MASLQRIQELLIMNKYTGLTEKYLLGQKRRSILTLLGIVLSVTLLTSIGTLGISYHDKLIRQAEQEYGDYEVSFNGVSGEAVPQILNQAVIDSTGVIHREGYVAISRTSEKEKQENPFAAPYRYLNVKGYDKGAMEKLQVRLESGRLPKNKHEILLSSLSLQHFAVKPAIGDEITVQLGDRINADTREQISPYSVGDFGWSLDEVFKPASRQKYTVVGYMQPSANASWSSSFIYPAITYDDHQQTDAAHKYFVYATMKSMDHIQDKAESILTSLAVDSYDSGTALELSRETMLKSVGLEYNDALLKLYGKSIYEGVNHSLFYAFAAIIFIIMGCTSAVIYNTFHISVLERISQFGMLRCIGATPKQIRKIVLKEAGILSLLAIPAGLFIGTVLMKILFYNISLLALGSLNDMHMIISLPVLAAASALGLLTVYLSALGPARTASRVSPLEALKGSVGGVAIIADSPGRQGRIAKRLFGFEGAFASRNIRRNRKKFRITSFSIMISMILFIVFQGLSGYLGTPRPRGLIIPIRCNMSGPRKEFLTPYIRILLN